MLFHFGGESKADLLVIRSLHRSESTKPLCDFSRDTQDRLQQLSIDGNDTLVLDGIALSMSLIQDTPLRCGKGERVRQSLEDDVAFLRSIAVPAKCRQGERMRGVVR